MAETWTAITDEADPDSGHEAVEKARVFRDNDDALVRVQQTHQATAVGAQNLNNTFSTTEATGVVLKWYKSAHVKKLSFEFYVGKTGLAGPTSRVWGKVRFNNDAGLETSLFDSNVSDPPWAVVDFDVSSLSEGWYDAEIYAGTDYADGTDMTLRLPAGGLDTTTLPIDNNSVGAFEFHDPDWTTSPTSDTLDAALAVDEGHNSTIGQAWYDRDEKLRIRPFGIEIAERSGTGPTGSTFSGIFTAYVPKWANTLHVFFEVYVTGGTGTVLLSDALDPSDADYRNAPTLVAPVGAYDGTLVECQINVSGNRGQRRFFDLKLINDTGGQSTFARILNTNVQAKWSALRPLPTRSVTALEWREWPATARSQNAFLHAAWWRRMKNRDLELHERSLYARSFTGTLSSPLLDWTQLGGSRMTLYQPPGLGASGGELVCGVELAGTNGSSGLRLNYSDLTADTAEDLTNVNNGEHILHRPLLSARDGSEQEFIVSMVSGLSGQIVRNTERLRPVMCWRIQD